MGESKRRQQKDPNYGKVHQKKPTDRRPRFDPKRITSTEWVIWAALLGGTAALFVSTYFWQ